MSDYRKEMTTGEYSHNPNSFYYPPPPLPELQAHPHDQQAPLPLGPHYGYIPPCPEGDNLNDDAKYLASLRRDDGVGGSDGTTSTQRNHSGVANGAPTLNYHHNYHFNHHYGGIMLPPSSHDNQYYRPQMQFVPTNQTWVTPNDAVQTNESSSPPPLYSTEAPSILTGSSGSSESQLSQSSSSEATAIGRPAPAKSAFMCFFNARRTQTKDGAVEVAAIEWQRLSHKEKAHWEGAAENEKVRFKIEREAVCKNNNGPLARNRRAKKDPLAPKRPMSAFLMYAQQKRKPLQRENPDMPNADISRLLGEIWKGISMVEKRPFLEREEAERRIYKAKVEKWKNNMKFERSMMSLSKPESNTKMPEQLQDVVPLAQEEPHEQTYVSYGEDQHGAILSPTRHEYNYDGGGWTPLNYQASHVQYTYPRPPEPAGPPTEQL